MTAEQVQATIVDALEDAKAEDIVTIDLRGKSDIADYMVIASGTSTRHVAALADKVEQKLHISGHNQVQTEGLEQCDWVLVDTIHCVVHLFRPEMRAFYNLEKMWGVPVPDEMDEAVRIGATA